MSFNFVSFIRQHHISYIERGPNVARGHINIRCPFCGPRDKSEHMGIELATGHWGCWRDSFHRGKKPQRLIQALIRCTWEEANTLAEAGIGPAPAADLRSRMDQLLITTPARAKLAALPFPDEFFQPSMRRGRRFLDFLADRDFAFDDAEAIVEQYALHAALSGRFAHRLILPFVQGNRTVGWTGRAIAEARLRYISFPDSEVVKQILFNYEQAKEGGRALFIVEGPIDCLKVDFYGQSVGFRAVATLGVNTTPAQVALLFELAPRYDDTFLLFDPAACLQAFRLLPHLSRLGVKQLRLDSVSKAEDPGALYPDEVLSTLKALAYPSAATV